MLNNYKLPSGKEQEQVIEKQVKIGAGARAAFCWRLVLLLLLFLSCALQALAFVPDLSGRQLLMSLLYMLSGFVMTVGFREYKSRGNRHLPELLLLLPTVLLFLCLGPRQILTGSASFLHRQLDLWNQRFDLGLSVPAAGNAASLPAFACFLFYLMGCLSSVFYSKSQLLKVLLCLLFLLIPLFSDCSVPLAGVLLAAVFLGERMTAGKQLSRRRVIWTAGVLLFLLLCIGMDQRTEISAAADFRARTEKAIRELRYGEDTLPEGDLRQAGILQASDECMLTVTASQAKNLYLRGFVGSRYADGSWQPLRKNDFSTAERSGILQWLQTRGFSVLKAPAAYWSLCSEVEMPAENILEIQVEHASRAYLYLPATVSLLDERHLGRVLDTRFSPRNLLGERHYTMRERSENLPSELLTAADWLTAPETEAQQQYCTAEAEYRTLVYELYTETDPELEELLQQYFWTDYETENAGIYRAISRVRQILRENIQYTEKPTAAPADTEPIRWMLTTSKKGNAVLFAAVAAEALRLQGIPTRYVEGYFASEADFLESSDGSVSLSGRNAHAWVEIYFDGMGWLPVDVTPGYYYDAVVLQQMYNAPETAQTTAADENGQELFDTLHSTASASDSMSVGIETPPNMRFGVWNRYLSGGLFLLTLLLLLILLLLLMLSGFFLLLGLRMYLDKRKYARLDPAGKRRFLQKRIFDQLQLLGLSAVLGLAAEETDRQLHQRFPDFAVGSYLRVSEILEKAVYGEAAPEAYELRVLESFSRRLAQLPFFGIRNITSGNLTVRGILDIMKTLT